jgi:hypothetical protein
MSKIRIIKASKSLQIKAGTGEIEEEKITKAEVVIENNVEDFAPIANEFLKRLSIAIETARAEGSDLSKNKILKAGMTQPVMELKANARMFKYDLVTSLANIMLGFLENVKELDKDAIEIVGAHHKTLSAIIVKKMKGDGGSNGMLFQTELEDAVERYFRKRFKKSD